jgi:hypothetical protein
MFNTFPNMRALRKQHTCVVHSQCVNTWPEYGGIADGREDDCEGCVYLMKATVI